MNYLPKLDDLVRASHSLQNGKVTERKKAMEKVAILLKNQDVLSFLNSGKSKKSVSWTTLFEAAMDNVLQDVQAITESKQGSKATTINTRKTKMKQSCAFLKSILKFANKGSAMVKLSKLISALVRTLQNSQLAELLGGIFVNILSNDLLSHRKYTCQMKVNEYKNLLEILHDMSGNKAIEKSTLVKCYIKLIKAMSQTQDAGNFTNASIYEFLTNQIMEVIHEKNPTIIELLIECSNVATSWMCISQRPATVSFTEKVFDAMLTIWNNFKHSTNISKCITTFFINTLKFHHPTLAVTAKDNGMIFDLRTWPKKLNMLLSVIEKNLQTFECKSNYRLHNKVNDEKYLLHYLAGYVIHVICQLHLNDLCNNDLSSSFDITSATQVQSFAELTSYDFVIQLLQPSVLPKQGLVDVLSIILSMQDNFPDLIDDNCLLKLSEKLCAILSEVGDKYVCELSIMNLKLSLRKIQNIESIDISWNSLWTTVKCFLYQNPTFSMMNAIMSLLTSLLTNDLKKERKILKYATIRDILQVVYEYVHPTSDSIMFVKLFMTNYDLFEQQKTTVEMCRNLLDRNHQRVFRQQYKDCVKFEEAFLKHPLKILFIDWIFKYKEEQKIINESHNNTSLITQVKPTDESSIAIIYNQVLFEHAFVDCNTVTDFVAFLCNKYLDENIQQTGTNACKSILPTFNTFTNCFDFEYVSMWSSFHKALLTTTATASDAQPSTNSKLEQSLARTALHALLFNMELTRDSKCNFDSFAAWGSQSLPEYIYLCTMAIQLLEKQIQTKVEFSKISDFVFRLFTDVKLCTAKFLDEVAVFIWQSVDMQDCVCRIFNQLNCLISSISCCNLTSKYTCEELTKTMQNLLNFYIAGPDKNRRKSSYESVRSGETTSEDFDLLDDEDYSSGNLLDDNFELTFPSTSRKRKADLTQFGPEAKRSVSDVSGRSTKSELASTTNISVIDSMAKLLVVLKCPINQVLARMTTNDNFLQNFDAFTFFELFLTYSSNQHDIDNAALMDLLAILTKLFQMHHNDQNTCSQLLHILHIALKNFSIQMDVDNKEKISNLMEIFEKIISKHSISKLRVTYVETMSQLVFLLCTTEVSSLDINFDDKLLKPDKMVNSLIQFLADLDETVKLCTALQLDKFFKESSSSEEFKQVQKMIIEEISNIIKDRNASDGFNLVALSLCHCGEGHVLQIPTLAAIIKVIALLPENEVVSHTISKKYIAQSCMDFIEYKTQKSVTHISIKDNERLLNKQLLHILESWFESSSNMSNFPFHLFGCDSLSSFCTEQQGVLFCAAFTQFFSLKDVHRFVQSILFQQRCGDVSKVTEKLVVKYFPMLFNRAISRTGNDSYKKLEVVLSKPQIQNLIASNFVDVFLAIVSDQTCDRKATAQKLHSFIELLNYDASPDSSSVIIGQILIEMQAENVPHILLKLRKNILLSTCISNLNTAVQNYTLVANSLMPQLTFGKQLAVFTAYDVVVTLSYASLKAIQNWRDNLSHDNCNLLNQCCVSIATTLKNLLKIVLEKSEYSCLNYDWKFASNVVCTVMYLHKNDGRKTSTAFSDIVKDLLKLILLYKDTSIIGKLMYTVMVSEKSINESNCLEHVCNTCRMIQQTWSYFIALGDINQPAISALLHISTAAFKVCQDYFMTCIDQEEATKTYSCLTKHDMTDKSNGVKLVTLIGKIAPFLNMNYTKLEKFEANFESKLVEEVFTSIFSDDVQQAECAFDSMMILLTFPNIQTAVKKHNSTITNCCSVFAANAGKGNKVQKSAVSTDITQILNDCMAMSSNSKHVSFNEWICKLVSGLLTNCSNQALQSVSKLCKLNLTLSSHLLPWCFKDLISNYPKSTDHLSQFVNSFAMLGDIAGTELNKRISMSIINLLQFLRNQPSPKKSKSHWKQNFMLDFDYLLLAEMASNCSMYYHVLLYIEIWINSSEMTLEKNAGNKEKSQPKTPGRTSRVLSFSEDAFYFPELDSQKSQKDFLLGRSFGTRNGVDILKYLGSEGQKAKDLLVKASSGLRRSNLLQGLNYGENLDLNTQAAQLEKEDRYFESLQLYDIVSTHEKSESNQVATLGMLYSCGLENIASQYSQLIDNDHQMYEKVNETKWKSLTKLSQWDAKPTKAETEFQPSFHACLSMMNENELELSQRHLNICKGKVLKSICSSNNRSNLSIPESCMNLIKSVYLNQAEDVLICAQAEESGSAFKELGIKQRFYNDVHRKQYTNAEDLFNIQTCLLKILKRNSPTLHEMLENILHDHCKMCLEYALECENLALMKQNLCYFQMASKAGKFDEISYNALQCDVLWKSGDKVKATLLCNDVCHKLENKLLVSDKKSREYVKDSILLSRLLLKQGSWLKESQSSSSETINEEFLLKSVRKAESILQNDSLLTQFDSGMKTEIDLLCVEGHRTVANFADKECRNIVAYMNSPEFEQKKTLIRNAQDEIEQAINSKKGGKYLVFLQRNYKLDETELNSILEKREEFLLTAIEHYVKCLKASDQNDLVIYRLVSLWFDNINSNSMPGFMQSAWSEFPSYKYVTVYYQLAARLNNSPSENLKFQTTLNQILKKVANDHPHHVIPVLLALSNAHKDCEYLADSRIELNRGNMDGRVSAANHLLANVDKKCKQLVQSYRMIFDAYIEIAYLDVTNLSKRASTSQIEIPKKMTLSKLTKMSSAFCKTLSNIIVPTLSIPINKTGSYGQDLVTFSYFKPYFKLCGGINVPKVFVAVGSDGKERKHLVKGKDDLRQDAVMQQVFQVVNSLLLKNSSSNSAPSIRTYKIVPLSQRSGLVEWCDGTVPIGAYLLGVPKESIGAHQLYRPDDKLGNRCRAELSNASRSEYAKKLEVFRNICDNFKPVMRYFFFEKFKDPSEWFDKRQMYTASVATTSIVGYILGLGDRHIQNILIDCETAELVHIDFGVAFEQGKCLPTPETVPFRLTRDIVDGFGIIGVEGPFRKTCEETLRVLRSAENTICTIVEVLLHDPLHDWVLTPGKAINIQRSTNNNGYDITENTNINCNITTASTVDQLLLHKAKPADHLQDKSSLAGRALLRVQEKLQGVEEGSILSISGQVNLLIQQATDMKKLCQLFAGWQPYV